MLDWIAVAVGALALILQIYLRVSQSSIDGGARSVAPAPAPPDNLTPDPTGFLAAMSTSISSMSLALQAVQSQINAFPAQQAPLDQDLFSLSATVSQLQSSLSGLSFATLEDQVLSLSTNLPRAAWTVSSDLTIAGALRSSGDILAQRVGATGPLVVGSGPPTGALDAYATSVACAGGSCTSGAVLFGAAATMSGMPAHSIQLGLQSYGGKYGNAVSCTQAQIRSGACDPPSTVVINAPYEASSGGTMFYSTKGFSPQWTGRNSA